MGEATRVTEGVRYPYEVQDLILRTELHTDVLYEAIKQGLPLRDAEQRFNRISASINLGIERWLEGPEISRMPARERAYARQHFAKLENALQHYLKDQYDIALKIWRTPHHIDVPLSWVVHGKPEGLCYRTARAEVMANRDEDLEQLLDVERERERRPRIVAEEPHVYSFWRIAAAATLGALLSLMLVMPAAAISGRHDHADYHAAAGAVFAGLAYGGLIGASRLDRRTRRA